MFDKDRVAYILIANRSRPSSSCTQPSAVKIATATARNQGRGRNRVEEFRALIEHAVEAKLVSEIHPARGNLVESV